MEFVSKEVLQAQLAQTSRAILRLNELLDLYERQERVLRQTLEDMELGLLPKVLTSTSLGTVEQTKEERRKPDTMRRAVYKDKKLADVILSVFDDPDPTIRSETLSIDDLAKLIYDTRTREEVNACKSSLTAVLNRCVEAEELIRVKPGKFSRNREKQEQQLKFLYEQRGRASGLLSDKALAFNR